MFLFCFVITWLSYTFWAPLGSRTPLGVHKLVTEGSSFLPGTIAPELFPLTGLRELDLGTLVIFL
jgi:hypothetical protein